MLISSKSTQPRITEKETTHYANNKWANSSKSTKPRIIEKKQHTLLTINMLTINVLIVVKVLNQE